MPTLMEIATMSKTTSSLWQTIGAVVVAVSVAAGAAAQGRTEITINDADVSPENLTSSQDGTVYFGSTAKGTIYRASPGAPQAEPWIQAATAGLTNVLGVLAHDASNTLWVCANSTGGRGGAPVNGQTALRSFDLRTGAAKGTYPFPDGGLCNDIAIGPDGAAYASDTFAGRILRLRSGATTLDVWAMHELLGGVDGLSFLADGALYANSYFSGALVRIPVNADGAAGNIVALETSVPFRQPDGLRTVGPRTLVQIEGQGRLTEITIDGTKADVRVLQEGLTRGAGVTVIGDTALVLIERLKAVAVPYRPGAEGR